MTDGDGRVANIGPVGIRRRRLAAIFALVVAAGIAAAPLVSADVARWWRFAALPPLAFAALCWFQASEKT